MGLFTKNKQANEPLEITGKQLIDLLYCAADLAAEEVESKAYFAGPEIMFDYHDGAHFLGIKYDKKGAKKAGLETFTDELMTVYLDNIEFASLEELRDKGMIEDILLKDIDGEIFVDQEVKDLLY